MSRSSLNSDIDQKHMGACVPYSYTLEMVIFVVNLASREYHQALFGFLVFISFQTFPVITYGCAFLKYCTEIPPQTVCHCYFLQGRIENSMYSYFCHRQQTPIFFLFYRGLRIIIKIIIIYYYNYLCLIDHLRCHLSKNTLYYLCVYWRHLPRISVFDKDMNRFLLVMRKTRPRPWQ